MDRWTSLGLPEGVSAEQRSLPLQVVVSEWSRTLRRGNHANRPTMPKPARSKSKMDVGMFGVSDSSSVHFSAPSRTGRCRKLLHASVATVRANTLQLSVCSIGCEVAQR
eukprot:244514-Amphidinium_carterae.1